MCLLPFPSHRSLPIAPSHLPHAFDKSKWRTRLEPGHTVEVDPEDPDDVARYGRDFLRIRYVFESAEGSQLVGWRLRRTRVLEGLLPQASNECFLVAQHEGLDYSLQTIAVAKACGKRSLKITNAIFPRYSCHEQARNCSTDPTVKRVRQDLRDATELVCRWMYIETSSKEATLRRISEAEADSAFRITDRGLYLAWRGQGPPAIAASRYSYGDCFSGAGGNAVGARQAGLRVAWAFDRDMDACNTFRRNFPEALVDTAEVADFNSLTGDQRCDIIHISTVCKPFSPANTGVGRRNPASLAGMNDEMNEAAMFCISELLEKSKCRIATAEQTSGLLTHHRRGFFKRFISQFTASNFSIRYEIMDLAEYGVPQHRKRLILFAACPGGVLPDFPPATHGPGRRWPFVTIAACLAGLRSHHTEHHPIPLRVPVQPYSADTLLRALISCGGTSNAHPSGTRKFTIRELAGLQTFPFDFQFGAGQSKTVKKSQIGNAVPPVASRRLNTVIVQALKDDDIRYSQPQRMKTELGTFESAMSRSKVAAVINLDVESDMQGSPNSTELIGVLDPPIASVNDDNDMADGSFDVEKFNASMEMADEAS